LSDAKIPIRKLWKCRDRLDESVDSHDWDESAKLAEAITAGIRDAVDPSLCGGQPTLDGLYTIGNMRYARAPKKTKKAITKMNRILRTAKRNVPKPKAKN
jgi:hypothetical protein